jgi:hypothetical protein
MKAFIEQEPLVAETDRAIAFSEGASYEDKIYDAVVERAWMATKLAGMIKLQDVRDALKQYGKVVPEFVSRCNGELWHRPLRGTVVPRGFCIFQMANFLVHLHGATATDEFLKMQGLTPEWDMAKEIAIAREIAERHS